MKNIQIIVLASMFSMLIACAEKSSDLDTKTREESKNEIDKQKNSELDTNSSAESTSIESNGWSLDQNESKMNPGTFNNVLTKEIATENTKYIIQFKCNSLSYTVYDSNGQGKAIPWEVSRNILMGNYVSSRAMQIRFGEKTINLASYMGEYQNTGFIQEEMDFWTILKEDILNIANIIPGEILELNPANSRSTIEKFTSECDKINEKIRKENEYKINYSIGVEDETGNFIEKNNFIWNELIAIKLEYIGKEPFEQNICINLKNVDSSFRRECFNLKNTPAGKFNTYKIRFDSDSDFTGWAIKNNELGNENPKILLSLNACTTGDFMKKSYFFNNKVEKNCTDEQEIFFNVSSLQEQLKINKEKLGIKTD